MIPVTITYTLKICLTSTGVLSVDLCTMFSLYLQRDISDLMLSQKYCHLPKIESFMAETYCAGTQYIQYLDASVGPNWIAIM